MFYLVDALRHYSRKELLIAEKDALRSGDHRDVHHIRGLRKLAGYVSSGRWAPARGL
jgi:hypothetical protein